MLQNYWFTLEEFETWPHVQYIPHLTPAASYADNGHVFKCIPKQKLLIVIYGLCIRKVRRWRPLNLATSIGHHRKIIINQTWEQKDAWEKHGGMGVDVPHSQTSTLEQSFSDKHIVFSQIDLVSLRLIQWRLHLCLNIQHFLHTTTTISNVQNCQFSIDLDAEAEHQQLNSQTMQNYSQQQCSYCISNPIQSNPSSAGSDGDCDPRGEVSPSSAALPSSLLRNPIQDLTQLICHLLSADCNPSSQVMIRCQMSDPTQCYSCVWVIVSNSDESGGLSWIPTWI